ncbi:MAG TPA: hypothetical protein PKD85_00205 [Saprospiraceae bacterium]|nr:hypothetical protein [Saprospiraceae bacterium]
MAFQNTVTGIAHDTGAVLRILYFLTLGRFRKIFIFTGLCIKSNKRAGTYTLQNFHGKDVVEINFSQDSPYIVSFDKLLTYNFDSKTKGNRLDLTKRYRLKHQPYKRPVGISEKRIDPYDYIYSSTVILPERQRIRRKFRF